MKSVPFRFEIRNATERLNGAFYARVRKSCAANAGGRKNSGKIKERAAHRPDEPPYEPMEQNNPKKTHGNGARINLRLVVRRENDTERIKNEQRAV